MKIWFLSSLLSLTITASVQAAESENALEAARAEIAPLFAEMQAAANAHDTDRHVAFFAREPSLLFIINDEAIIGWEALREKQLQWWNNGKTDVVYTQVGQPDYRMPAPGLVMLTHFLTSRRTLRKTRLFAPERHRTRLGYASRMLLGGSYKSVVASFEALPLEHNSAK